MERELLTDDGTPLRLRVLGEQSPGALDVLLLHGWMASSKLWDDVLPLLDLRGRRLLVPDLRGAGGSGKPASGYTLERYGRDALAVLDAVSSTSAVVIGHSMGGAVTQWLAATAPSRVKAAVAITPVPLSGIPMPDDAVGLFSTSGGSREKQKTILSICTKQLTDAARDRLLDDAGAIPAAVIAEGFAAWHKGLPDVSLKNVSAPFLVLATDDPFTPPPFMKEAIAGRMQRGRVCHLPGPGHYPMLERPEETAALLEAFLAGVG